MMAMALSMGIIVDGIIVGNTLGSDALAAVNLVMPITLCFNTIYAMFGIGGGSDRLHCKGKKGKPESGCCFLRFLYSACWLSALFFLILGVFFLDKLAQLLAGNSSACRDWYVNI